MQIASALLCLTLIVIASATLLIIFLVNRNRNDQPVKEEAAKRVHHGGKAWLAYIAIALVLAIWSILAALFFLAVVWVMRQNPGPDSSPTVGDMEKRTARRVYMWLFFSSIITVPVFLIAVISSYSRNSSANEHALSALIPLVFHLPLLAGLTSKSTFVYRHAQQGIMLIALRAGVAILALSISDYPEDGIWLFLLGNGSLWLFGSIWGWAEVRRGACWWMKRKGEAVAIDQAGLTEIKPAVNSSPEQHLEYSRWYARHDRKDEARQNALDAFRLGSPDVRRQAVRLLEDLKEVEFF